MDGWVKEERMSESRCGCWGIGGSIRTMLEKIEHPLSCWKG